jgi:hypothetical protein
MEGTIPHQHEVEERLQLSQVELEQWAKTYIQLSEGCSGLWSHLAPSLSRFEADYSTDVLTSLIEGTIPHQNEVEERIQLSQVELEQWVKTYIQLSEGCSGLCWLHLAPRLSRFDADYSIDSSLTSLMEGTILPSRLAI